MNATKTILTLTISTLLGACGGAADEMLTGLDESQITTAISCADMVNALVKRGDGGALAPAKGDGGALAPSVEATEKRPGDGGALAPSVEATEARPGDGGALADGPGDGGALSSAPLVMALSSDLNCGAYNVEVTGNDIDAGIVVINDSAAVEVNEDGTFVHNLTMVELEDLVLESL